MRRRSSRQRGVAIITALVVVAAATVAVSAMMWRQAIAVRKVENQGSLEQARWLARSAIEWARLMLQLDARTSVVDHLGEVWATPLAETRVTEDLTSPAAKGSAATVEDLDTPLIAGRMRDAQSRLNLNGLGNDGQVDEARFAVLKRLISILQLREETAKAIAVRMVQMPLPDSYDELIDELAADPDADRATLERLRPFVDVLPARTPVNLNTAGAEVIAATFEDLPIDAARALVRSREQAWFNQVSDAVARLPGTSGKVAPTNVSVATNWFELDGHVRVGRAEIAVDALIERQANGATRVRSFVER